MNGLIALRSPARRHLRGEPDPVQQARGTPQRVAHMEQPPDQPGHPVQGPALVLGPSPGRRARIQRGAQPGQLPGDSRHTAPLAPFEASAAVPLARQRRRH